MAGIRALAALAVVGVGLLAACTSPGPPAPAPTSPTTPAPSPSTPAPPPDVLDGWTIEEIVGQVVMVGLDLTAPAAVSTDVVRDRHVGHVFLHGRTDAGLDAVRDVVARTTAASTAGVPMLVAVDQEASNPPIGRFGRQYGATAEDVAVHAGAAAREDPAFAARVADAARRVLALAEAGAGR